MAVLVKDIKMPRSCEFCPCKTADAFGGLGCQATGYIPFRKANQDRPDWCPLVPVPPHGRLIDADEMFEYFVMEGQRSRRYKLGENWELNGEEIRKVIAELPEVIPAEDGET